MKRKMKIATGVKVNGGKRRRNRHVKRRDWRLCVVRNQKFNVEKKVSDLGEVRHKLEDKKEEWIQVHKDLEKKAME